MKIKNPGLKVSLIVSLMVAAIIGIIVCIVTARTSALIKTVTEKETYAADISFVRLIENLDGDVIEMLFSGIPIDDAPAGSKTIMNMALTAEIIGVTVCFFSVAAFNNSVVSRPLAQVVAILKRVEKCDMPARSEIAGEEEIGIVAEAVDHFLEEMQKVVQHIRVNSDTLAEASEQLSSVSMQLSSGVEQTFIQGNPVASRHMSINISAIISAAEEAMANTCEAAGDAEQMSVNMNTIARAVEEMSIRIVKINHSVEV